MSYNFQPVQALVTSAEISRAGISIVVREGKIIRWRRQAEGMTNNFSCLSYDNVAQNRNGSGTVRNYPTQIWFREMDENWELWLYFVAERSQTHDGKNQCCLSCRAKKRMWFLVPLMVHFLLMWLILRSEKKNIHSPLSKHRLSTCNLLVCCSSKEMEIACWGASYGCVLPSFSSSSSPPLSQAVTWYVDHPRKCVQIHYFPLQS